MHNRPLNLRRALVQKVLECPQSIQTKSRLARMNKLNKPSHNTLLQRHLNKFPVMFSIPTHERKTVHKKNRLTERKGEQSATRLHTTADAANVTLRSSSCRWKILNTSRPTPESTMFVRKTDTARLSARTQWHAAYRTPTCGDASEVWIQGIRCKTSVTCPRMSLSKRDIAPMVVSAA